MTRQRRWQLKHEEMGLCYKCSDQALVGKSCLKHAILARERAREITGAKRRNNSKSYRMERELA